MPSPSELGQRLLSSVRTGDDVEFCYDSGVTAETFQFAPAGEDDVDHSKVFTYLCRQLLRGKSPTDEDLKTLHNFERYAPGDLAGYVEMLRTHELGGRLSSIFLRQRREFGMKSVADQVRPHPEQVAQILLEELGQLNVARTRRWIRGDKVKAVHPKWLWHRHIPEGKLTIFQGDPEVGKSILALKVAAHVSVGTKKMPWPTDSNRKSLEPGKVLVLTLEDNLDDTVIPRFTEFGGDLTNFIGLHADGPGIDLTKELYEVDSKLGEGGYKLMVLDSIDDFVPGIDSYKASDVRAVLIPLAQLAAKHNIAVIGLKHLRKSETSKAIYRGLGSIAWAAVARAMLLVEYSKDCDDPGERTMACVKMSVGLKPASWAFRLEPSKSDPDVPSFEWLDERDVTANELLTVEKKPRVTKVDQAISLLCEELEDHKWHESAPILTKFEENGGSQPTFSRAWSSIKEEFGGEEKWKGSGKDKQTLYRLPKRDQPY